MVSWIGGSPNSPWSFQTTKWTKFGYPPPSFLSKPSHQTFSKWCPKYVSIYICEYIEIILPHFHSSWSKAMVSDDVLSPNGAHPSRPKTQRERRPKCWQRRRQWRSASALAMQNPPLMPYGSSCTFLGSTWVWFRGLGWVKYLLRQCLDP